MIKILGGILGGILDGILGGIFTFENFVFRIPKSGVFQKVKSKFPKVKIPPKIPSKIPPKFFITFYCLGFH